VHTQQFPDLVDAFGNPILAWVEDPGAPRTPLEEADFAKDDARSNSKQRARYYHASNFGWLTSTSLGKGGMDQTLDTSSKKFGSLLFDENTAELALTAVLGSASFPTPINYTANNVLPSASRGAFVVHSAGADGVYFGVRDSGARALGVDGDTQDLEYKFNFYTGNDVRLTDEKGLDTTIDLTKGFDDILAGAGN
jgi:hypothetical protein